MGQFKQNQPVEQATQEKALKPTNLRPVAQGLFVGQALSGILNRDIRDVSTKGNITLRWELVKVTKR